MSPAPAHGAVGTGRQSARAGFVQGLVVVDQPYDDVVARFGESTRSLFEAALHATRSAEGHPQTADDYLQVRVGPAGWPPQLAKEVNLRVAAPRQMQDSTVISFTWEATGGRSLFPDFDADLRVAPVDIIQTELQIQGRYHPPAGLLGRQLDQLMVHRVAESTVRALLTSLASAIGPQRNV